MVNMRGKVRAKQQPEMRPDGSVKINGVRDAHFCNTDHVPVWYESVGNFSWGKRNSGRRHIRTGGKEKDQFTAQFSVGKDGTKLIPFLIFRGKVFLYVYVLPTIYISNFYAELAFDSKVVPQDLRKRTLDQSVTTNAQLPTK